MKYVPVAEARGLPGLRLVLSAGAPNPWCESAKALFKLRRVDFRPVEQEVMQPNDDLRAWTGVRNAPVAVLDDEPAVNIWLDILRLAERLGSGPSLLPADPIDQALSLGFSAEICGTEGFGWARRLTLFARNTAAISDPDATRREIDRVYGMSPDAVAKAPARVVSILNGLAEQLRRQKARGSAYLVGARLSACDIHWACFSQMVAPLPHTACPTPEMMRAFYENVPPEIGAALDPSLIHHRDMIFERHIGLPLDF